METIQQLKVETIKLEERTAILDCAMDNIDGMILNIEKEKQELFNKL